MTTSGYIPAARAESPPAPDDLCAVVDGQDVLLTCPSCGLFEYAKPIPVAIVAVWRPAASGSGRRPDLA